MTVRKTWRWAVLVAAAGLAGCHLPQPMRDHPGRLGAILSAPPPARLAVGVPGGGLLDDKAAKLWAHDVTVALLDQTIPAVDQAVRPGDWQLQLRAHVEGARVVPGFVVLTPQGKVKGQRDGAPVSAARWSAGDPAALHEVAAAAAPQIVTVLTGLRTAEMRADPDSLMNRPAKIFFAGVKGAPGDGDAALAAAMRQMLPDPHDELVADAAAADYRVTCTVHVDPPEASPDGRVQKTEIVWHVAPRQGREAGAVTQLHAVPAGSLDHAWGETATAVVTEAAPGIRTVIDNNSSRVQPPPPGAAVTAPVGLSGVHDPAAPVEGAAPPLNSDLPDAVAPFRAAQQADPDLKKQLVPAARSGS